jgi:hypothetical protein
MDYFRRHATGNLRLQREKLKKPDIACNALLSTNILEPTGNLPSVP